MKDVIDQFMWGYQQHFRLSVQRGIARALEAIGLPVEVRVVLVGFALSEEVRHAICVEPEEGVLHAAHLAEVGARTEALVLAHPESKMIYSHPRISRARHTSLFQRCRAQAIVEAIESSGVFAGLSFFASNATEVGGYDVHLCAGIRTSIWNSFPALLEDVVDRFPVGRSLQHEIIAECFRRSRIAMHLPDPGADLYPLGDTADDIVKGSAVRLSKGMVYRVAGMPTDLFETVNAISSLGYERADASGRLVFTAKSKAIENARVHFQRPISIHESRTMRKLLETTGSYTALLSDFEYAYGLGEMGSGPDAVEVLIQGRATWELSFNSKSLMKVAYGRATLPRPLLNFAQFEGAAARTVGDIDCERVWRIVQAAQASGKGTTLIVSSNPAEEAARLGGQGVAVEAVALEPDEIVRLCRIDGAVLLGSDGHCYAFGLILDGVASGKGDPARGARFNSALRYHHSVSQKSVLVVISDDGTVDLIPALRPQVSRCDVEDAVREFCELCQEDPVRGEEFSHAYDHVRRLSFYLNEGQCQRVNEAYANEMQHRFNEGGVMISEGSLRPHPDMNDSYFV